MEVDVLIVGAGPAGLAAACRIGQMARETNTELNVVVLEKGSEAGAHILSGAVFEPTALDELFPDWKERGAPLNTPVSSDSVYYFTGARSALKVPGFCVPHTMHNRGNYIISLGNLCRWLADQATALGVEVLSGFAASEIIYDEKGAVKGVLTGDMGVAADGSQRAGFTPGIALHAKYCLFAEGSRGHLGKQLIKKYQLDANCEPQHYAIGIKELWQVESGLQQPGTVIHTAGWPLSEHGARGGGFLYHLEDGLVSLGLITDLSYTNPWLSPYEEFQRFKLHPKISATLKGGKRLSYGARSITKGGLQSMPDLSFPGGLLIGCNAGTLNFAKIKGSHTAMKSGMIAAEIVFTFITSGAYGSNLKHYKVALDYSWVGKELHRQRNFGPAQQQYGNLLGSAYSLLDLNLFRGRLPWTLKNMCQDSDTLKTIDKCKKIDYPAADGVLTFDRNSSVFLSNTNHEENQPCHLRLIDPELPISKNLPLYDEPAQCYCPAGVYEVVHHSDGVARFQINAQNCVHCKTCDIKDPQQNIEWVPPEGGGGPNYPNM